MAIQSAAETVLESIEVLLAGQDDRLVMPLTTLNKATADLVGKNAKIVTRMQEKILRDAARNLTHHDNALDAVSTRVLAGLDNWQYDAQFLLTQLAAKGGFTKIGEPLEAALEAEVLKAPELAYVGTLVLAVKEAVPYFVQLIEVLREIRDRMPPLALHLQGEARSTAGTEGEAGTEPIEPATPIDQADVPMV